MVRRPRSGEVTVKLGKHRGHGSGAIAHFCVSLALASTGLGCGSSGDSPGGSGGSGNNPGSGGSIRCPAAAVRSLDSSAVFCEFGLGRTLCSPSRAGWCSARCRTEELGENVSESPACTWSRPSGNSARGASRRPGSSQLVFDGRHSFSLKASSPRLVRLPRVAERVRVAEECAKATWQTRSCTL